MYGLLALAALALAGLTEGTRFGLRSALDQHNVARSVAEEGIRSVKVKGDDVILERREGCIVSNVQNLSFF